MILLLVLLTATTAFAQRGHHRGHGEKGTALLQELDLSAGQQEQLQLIRKDTRTQLEALRANGKDRDANRDAAKAIRQQGKTAALAVLTPEQRAELDAKKEAKKAAWEAVDKKALRAELKAYRQETIKPVLRAARGQLDQFIAPEDRAEIARLRQVFAERPKARGKKRTEAHKTAREQWRAAHAGDVASLEGLVTKYRTELDRAGEILAPSRKTWRDEMAAIKAKYLPEGMAPRGGKGGPKARRGKGKGQPAGGRKRGNDHKAAAFLLMKS